MDCVLDNEEGALSNGMYLMMRILIAVVLVAILYSVFRLISQGKLLLKYSLLWMLLCVVTLLCDAFPGIVYWAADAIGFLTPSNFVLLVAVVLLLTIALSLSVAVSRAVVANKNLTQRLALIEYELKDLKEREQDV